jgi:hexosaminidase
MKKPIPSLLPQPKRVQGMDGEWSCSRPRICATPAAALSVQADLLAAYLCDENQVSCARGTPTDCDIHLVLDRSAQHPAHAAASAGFTDESHRLRVEPQRITLAAASPAGLAMGLQTLRQLFSGQRGKLEIPCLELEDAPALVWRGLHLDVSRHFFDSAQVKRFIDVAAFHKFNLFHWHLTDDQGWRLPVEGYPRLAEVAAWRDGTMVGHDKDRKTNPSDGIRHGGMYAEAEIREVVAYAAARGIHVLPEVDVPGHVQALVTAYPDFGNTGRAPGVRECWGIGESTLNLEEGTFRFLDRMVDTLADLFPFTYLHFGGDEALTGEWAASPLIQAHKARLGLAADAEVQDVFTRHLARRAAIHGRRVIGWDEIIEHHLPPAGTAVMYWRAGGKEEGRLDLKALRHGHPVVLANGSHTYFDHYQAVGDDREKEPLAIGGELPWQKVYAWKALADIPGELRPLVLGAQAQLWTEYIPEARQLDYMTYPRACALAQVLWTGEGREDMGAFAARLADHLRRLDRLGVRYRPLSGG